MAVKVLRDVRPWDSSIYGFRNFTSGDVVDGPVGVWLAAVCPADIKVLEGGPAAPQDGAVDGAEFSVGLPAPVPVVEATTGPATPAASGDANPDPVQGAQTPSGDSPDDPAAPFNPADHTGPDVVAYAKAHPEQAAAIYDSEFAGKGRSTVLAALAALKD